jgi:hypothetical protein
MSQASEESGTDIELGPIDYLIVEWPAEKQPTGEAFPLLLDLVDRGLIRVLDPRLRAQGIGRHRCGPRSQGPRPRRQR